MPEPLEDLRLPDGPIFPDPDFAAGLRVRLARALGRRKGASMSSLTMSDQQSAAAVGAVLTPYIAVSGARDALDWYSTAFGARLVGAPIVMPDNRIGHAEIEIAGARLMLSEEHPEIGVTAPRPGLGVPFTLHLEVQDVDEVIRRAVAAGAALERPAENYEYGRNGVLRDPFGHRWMISGTPVPVAPGLRHGDIGYVSLRVRDVGRAAAFFSAALGWEYEPGGVALGRQVLGHRLHHGLWGGFEHPTLFCCYAVSDLAAAAERARAAGGAVGAPRRQAFGLVADGIDPEGTDFALFEPPGGTITGAAAGPTGEGDLAYVAMEVVSSGAARDFYGAVLGWRFTPGGSTDGWQVQGAVPMVGISGGHPRPTTVPMYRVDDIVAAVGRARAAGGSATDPRSLPYGVTSACSDDQGTRFYLGQL